MVLTKQQKYKKKYYKKNKEYYKEYHEKRKEKYKVKRKEKYNKRKKYIDQIKLESGCVFCGYNEHPAALDFDHIDPLIKISNISNLLLGSLNSLQAEIAKCQVLCSNCHRIKTYEERQENTETTQKLLNKLNVE